jgi:hypothetical protein
MTKECLQCLQQELQRVLGVEISGHSLKRAIIWLALYGAFMLLTFIATLLGFPLLFALLLAIELYLTYIILGFIVFLCSIYYGVYFAKKAWQRAEREL